MNNARVLKAQMARTQDGAHWTIYVVILGKYEWPEVRLPASDGIPSLARRSAALAWLGYVPSSAVPEWEWIEDDLGEELVHLIATLMVVPAETERLADSNARRS